MTTTTTKARARKLVTLPDGTAVYCTAKGLRLGARGAFRPDADVLGVLAALDKGMARRVRKALRAAGMAARAATPSTARPRRALLETPADGKDLIRVREVFSEAARLARRGFGRGYAS